MTKFFDFTKDIAKESVAVYWALIKIIIPVMIVVEIGIRYGLVDVLSDWSAPFMAVFGLPAEASLILVTTILVGLYPAAAVLITLAPEVAFTTADMTILGGMMLFAHVLPVEQMIVKKTGVSIVFSTFIRLLAMVIYGWLSYLILDAFVLFEEPANILISMDAGSGEPKTWGEWALSSVQGLVMIFVILVGLILLIKLLDISGITKRLIKWLTPVLRLIGIGPNAAPLAMVGILLGLSFGGGLIIREVEKGQLQPKSVFLSMIFICLGHSLIEDTLIILACGGHWSGIFVGRILLSFAMIIPIALMIKPMPDKIFYRFFYKMKKPAPVI